MAGEEDFISWIRSQTISDRKILLPPGDDLAVLRWNGADLLIAGADQVLDGVHFDSAIYSPRAIGRKAMNRNLSDCAAMAALPAAAISTAALPRGCGVEYARELYLGMREAADPFDCPIVGGDTGSWNGKLVLTVTILGRSAGIVPVARSGGKPGDTIYVSGPLGGSLLGRHMNFIPRIELVRRLARSHRISAMIDLSDGLARDLRHLCHESGVGAELESGDIPIHPDAPPGRRSGSIARSADPRPHGRRRLRTAPGRAGRSAVIRPHADRKDDPRAGIAPPCGRAGDAPCGRRMGARTVKKPTAQFTDGPEQTERLAAELARNLVGGECIALRGDLGAGKTCFVRGLVGGLDADPRLVSSPTFVLLNIYPTPRFTVFHLDAYRVQGPEDFDAIGFPELLEQGGIVIVEWPQRVEQLLPTRHIEVQIEHEGEQRRRIVIQRAKK